MTYDEISSRLKKGISGRVIQHPDGSVSVDGSVRWEAHQLSSLPLKFKRVTGFFNCGANQLTSLDGAPDFVGGFFACYLNSLTSLDGLGEVKGAIECYGNRVSEDELLAPYRKKRARRDLTAESLAVDKIVSA